MQVPLHSSVGKAVVGGGGEKAEKWNDLKEEAGGCSGLFKTPALTKVPSCGLLRPEFRMMGSPTAAEKRL